MAMVPHERSLVKRFEHKPFVLLGVNADSSRDALKQTQERKQLSWRSWFDGRRGSIAENYRIQFWPTLLLIDHVGIIRKKIEGRPPDSILDAWLNQLVEEAENDL